MHTGKNHQVSAIDQTDHRILTHVSWWKATASGCVCYKFSYSIVA